MKRRRGLSLFEVVIALALVMLMFSTIFGFLYYTLQARGRVIELTGRRRAITALVENIERDLLTAVAHADGTNGIDDTETILVIHSRAVVARRVADGPDAVLADLERSRYRFLGPFAGIEFSRVAVGSGEPESRFISGESIGRVRFRYHDGSSWSDQFSSSGGLPTAIEIAIWYEPDPDELEDLEDEADDEAPLFERETFDANAGFDEDAAIEQDFGAEPLPDRVRVIVVPDADDLAAFDEGSPR